MHCVFKRALLGTAASVVLAGCPTGGDTSSSSSSSSSTTGGVQSSSAVIASSATSAASGATSAPASATSAPASATSDQGQSSSGVVVVSSSAAPSSSEVIVCDPDAPVCSPACAANQFCRFNGSTAVPCFCETVPPVAILPRESNSTAIDLNRDDSFIAAANRDTGTVSIMRTSDNLVLARIPGMTDARSVVWHPDGTTLFVSHAAGVTRVSNANGASPSAEATLAVCAEPFGIALSPTGRRLFVACLDGKVVLVDTLNASLSITATTELRNASVASGGTLPANAAAVALGSTNDLDTVTLDGVEKVIVPLFYHDKVDVTSINDVDLAGTGVIAILSYDGVLLDRVDIAPEPDTGFGPEAVPAGANAGAFMNQLANVWVQRGTAYVTALAAAPKGAPGPAASNPDAGVVAGGTNTFPYLLVIDIATGTERARHNLNKLMQNKLGNAGNNVIRYQSVMSGIAFVPGTDLGYISNASSNDVIRIRMNADGSLNNEVNTGGFGSGVNNFIDTTAGGAAGNAPAGITITHSQPKGFVVNEVGRTIQVISFADQAVTATVVSENPPTPGSADDERLKGKKFYITSTGRWGNNGMVGCLACHPNNGALSDNVTWFFAAGPRQTVSMDGSFGKVDDNATTGAKTLLNQRAFNWTAIIDEMADFEGNTRGVSGGVGALVSAAGLDPANRLNQAGNLGPAANPPQALASNRLVTDLSVLKDWDEIDLFSLSIKAPQGKTVNPTAPQAAAITAGRLKFEEGGCTKCHGGSKWTVSRVPYTPQNNATFMGNTAPASVTAASVPYTPIVAQQNQDDRVVDDDDVAGQPIKRIACNLRKVGTFDANNQFEKRANMVTLAQGAGGFNPPSLLGVRYGSPFLHNGSVKTLTDLFATPAMDAHTTAGNAIFLINAATRAQEVSDLIAFLESIDETTTPFPTPAGHSYCPDVQ